MLVKQEQVTPCEVELEIQVETEKVDSALDETYAELGKVTNIPGFRKGKAPKAMLERYLDEEKVKDRVADKLLRVAYSEALEESKVEPFAPADVEVVKFEFGEPLVFKATVPLPPKVELGEYAGLEAERSVPPVTDEDIDTEIKRMLDRRAEYTKMEDREARKGDTVLIEMKSDDEPEEEPRRNVVQIGENLPDLDNGLTGMQLEEEKVIEVTYPDDFADETLRGQTLPIWVKLLEINEKHVPELTDEWVKKTFVREPEEGAEPDADAVDTVEKLRGKIRDAMEKAAQDVADTEVRNKVIEQVVANSTVNFPDVMVQEAVQERFEDLSNDLKKRKATIDDYLKYTGETAESIRTHYEEESKRSIEISLVFHEIMEKENIKAEDEDVEAEIASMAEEQGVPAETMKAYIDRTESISTIKNRVLRKKVVDFLVNASNIKNVGQ